MLTIKRYFFKKHKNTSLSREGFSKPDITDL